MPEYRINQSQQLTAGGGTVNLPIDDGIQYYWFYSSGTVVLAGNWVVQASSTPLNAGQLYWIYYDASLTLGANTLTIFGLSLTAAQALAKQVVVAWYDSVAAAWRAHLISDFSTAGIVEANSIATGAVTSAKILDGTIVDADINASAALARTKLAAGTPSYVLVNSAISGLITEEQFLTAAKGGTGITTAASTGIAKVAAGTWSVATIVNADINAAAAIVYTKLSLAGAVKASDLVTTARYFSKVIPCSFESGEQCNNIFYIQGNFTIVGLRGVVVKALAATDSGTITVQINTVAVTTGVLTFAASAALNNTQSATPSALNTYTGGAIIDIECVSAKTTAGGKVLVTLLCRRDD